MGGHIALQKRVKLQPMLETAGAEPRLSIIAGPIDYRESPRLSGKPGNLVRPT